MADSGAVIGNAPRRVAVVVVHGVGNTEPGSTVNYLVGALCAQKTDCNGAAVPDSRTIEPAGHNEIHMLPEPPSTWRRAIESTEIVPAETDTSKPPQPTKGKFPVYVRDAQLPAGGTATFYELHWSDLARGGNGWFDTAWNFARFVFEIPHVVDGFLRDPPGPFSRFLRRLLLLATCFVRGPLAGYCLVMLAGGLIFLSFGWIPDREEVAGLLGLAPEKSPGIFSLLPGFVAAPLQRLTGLLPNLGTRGGLLGVLATIMAVSIAVGLASRKILPLYLLAAFAGLVSAFYMLDVTVLRPSRYPGYEGLVFVDYLSVMLFGLFMLGIYIFRTRRITEAGFADLGLATGLWALFFVLHLSVLGDAVRQQFFSHPTIIETTVKTSSSKVHFDAFALFYPYLSYLWSIWASMMLVAFVLAIGIYLFNFRSWGDRHRGIFAALALAIVQSCVWLTALPALGVIHMDDVLCRGSRNYATVKQPVSCQSKLEWNNKSIDFIQRLRVQDDAALSNLTASMRDELDAAVQERFPHTLNFDMLKAMRELAISFIWHGFILVFATGIAVAVAVYRYFRSRRTSLPAAAVGLPRLIISNWVLACLLIFGMINIGLCFAWIEGIDALQPFMHQLGLASVRQLDVPAEVVQMAMLTTTILLVVGQLPQIRTPLSGVLQIMQGLIDHHYRIRVSIVPRLMARLKKHLINEPIRRDHITARLQQLFTQLIAKRGFTDVVFLSHSQGSVIVFDYLCGETPGLPCKAHVLTAGSPLGALYSYYFNEYGEMEHHLENLTPKVASWTNLYRSDDAIAGAILPPASAPTRLTYPFSDIAMAPGGHLRYWESAVVCDAIRNLLIGKPGGPGGA